jgi:hypothetical protein
MAGMKENAMIVTAVAVTAILCVYGMHAIITKTEPRQDIYITVSADIEDDIKLFVKEFESYALANIHISVTANPEVHMLGDNVDIIITTDGSIGNSVLQRVTPTETLHAYYKEGPKGMLGTFINWLEGQWRASEADMHSFSDKFVH